MKNKQRIIAVHLLNDRSGSPKVLHQLLNGWTKEDFDIHLFTNNLKGFLAPNTAVCFHKNGYRFHTNKFIRLAFYVWSQITLFFKILFFANSDDIVYVNTVLPFGAAIAGKIKKCKVIYHIHEVSIQPQILYLFLLKITKLTATSIINVSQFVADNHQITTVPNYVLHNAIDHFFLENKLEKKQKTDYENVLMVCSLKDYKGVFEFIKIAENLPEYSFRLVLNAQQNEIEDFFKTTILPQNISLFASQKDLHPFYQWTDLILNLSHKDRWIETFGLTILEGMAYGLPAIVPTVGGIQELIIEGKTGFSIDAKNTQQLSKIIQNIFSDPNLYVQLSAAAKNRLQLFNENNFINNSVSILNQHSKSWKKSATLSLPNS